MKSRYVITVLACLLASCNLAAQEGLCLSEVLYQPRSGEAEYVELYNNSSVVIDLAGYHIVRWVGDSLGKHYPLPSRSVAPHEYIVLTKDTASVAACYRVQRHEGLVQCQLPTYPNDGGSVILATADSLVVQRLDYQPSMHDPLIHNPAGVALERKRFDAPCNDADNWASASALAGYGTPTYANSQLSRTVGDHDFRFSTSLLSPDGDGYQDELVITYTLARDDLHAMLFVYDACGNKVSGLNPHFSLGTQGEIVWDGRGDNGLPLPAGRYLLHLVLFNTHGNQHTLDRTITIFY